MTCAETERCIAIHTIGVSDRLGVVSDTHGLLRSQVKDLLAHTRAIIHAGDVGDPSVLKDLGQIAPVYAVRGNIDNNGLCGELPEKITIKVLNRKILVRHTLDDIDISGFDLAICGHSHSPKISLEGTVQCLNPGSVGPRRFRLPVSMAFLGLSVQGDLTPELVTIHV
jgi:hypothetical protein